jgi:sugar lactone lactonase YvrE
VIGPLTLVVGNQGQIYIGENSNGRIVEFDSSGKLLAAWGNPGTYQVSSDILAAWGNTTAYQEQISEVGGLALDQDGSLYAADTFNNRVLKFRQH